MNPTAFTDLLDRYYNRSCTEEEKAQLFQLLQDPQYDVLLKEWIARVELLTGDILELPKPAADSILASIFNASSPSKPIPVAHRVHFLRTAWFRYAAILLLIASTATYIYQTRRPSMETASQQPISMPDILPGGNKAILTLADGRRIVLDSAANGALASQGDTRIIKLDAGSLAYNAGSSNGEVWYNTVSTPKGGQYQVVLPDGSKVWLNAASSIRFPTTFTKTREVTVTGETYMEVTPDATKPFLVNANDIQVQVLGTSFNINAYQDENAWKTTLVDGSIRVGRGKDIVTLKPGQQALVNKNDFIKVNRDANVAEALAWKNGLFTFEEADVPAVMRQLGRWYDVDIVYEGAIPARQFVGKIFREMTLNKVVKVLGNNGINCRIEGRTIRVQP